jgi:hypothetical protein
MHETPSVKNIVSNHNAAKPAKLTVSAVGSKNKRTKTILVGPIKSNEFNVGERPIQAIGEAKGKNRQIRYKIP